MNLGLSTYMQQILVGAASVKVLIYSRQKSFEHHSKKGVNITAAFPASQLNFFGLNHVEQISQFF